MTLFRYGWVNSFLIFYFVDRGSKLQHQQIRGFLPAPLRFLLYLQKNSELLFDHLITVTQIALPDYIWWRIWTSECKKKYIPEVNLWNIYIYIPEEILGYNLYSFTQIVKGYFWYLKQNWRCKKKAAIKVMREEVNIS